MSLSRWMPPGMMLDDPCAGGLPIVSLRAEGNRDKRSTLLPDTAASLQRRGRGLKVVKFFAHVADVPAEPVEFIGE